MSTRCQIGFYGADAKLKDFDALIYRHSDGYPSGVLPDIMPFLEWFRKERGTDTEYCAARLLQYLCNMYDRGTAELDRLYPATRSKQGGFTGTLGHGICKHFHWDIEYFYAICPDGVHVYETGMIDKDADVVDKSKLLGVVPYADYEQDKAYKALTKSE